MLIYLYLFFILHILLCSINSSKMHSYQFSSHLQLLVPTVSKCQKGSPDCFTMSKGISCFTMSKGISCFTMSKESPDCFTVSKEIHVCFSVKISHIVSHSDKRDLISFHICSTVSNRIMSVFHICFTVSKGICLLHRICYIESKQIMCLFHNIKKDFTWSKRLYTCLFHTVKFKRDHIHVCFTLSNFKGITDMSVLHCQI